MQMLSESPAKSVGQIVREIRKEGKISLNTLAKRAGISSSYLSQIERDKCSPTAKIVKRLAQALDVPISVIMGESTLAEVGTYEFLAPELRSIIRRLNEAFNNPAITLSQKVYLKHNFASFSEWLLDTVINQGQPLTDTSFFPQTSKPVSDIVDDEILILALGSRIRSGNVEEAKAIYQEVINRMKYTSRFVEMRRVVEELTEFLGDVDDPFRAALSYDLAYACLMLGEYKEGVEKCERGMQLARKFKDEATEADILWLMGENYRMMGEYRKGLEACHQAKRIYQRKKEKPSVERPGIIWALWNIARIYISLGEYDKALRGFQEVMRQNRYANIAEASVCTLWGIALIDDRQGHYQDASEKYGRARQLAEYSGDKFWEGCTLWGIAESLRKLTRLNEALAVARAGKSLFRNLGNEDQKAWLECSVGDVQLMLGEYQTAIQNYSEAIEVFNHVGNRHEKAMALSGLATARLMIESQKVDPDYKEILNLYKEAREVSSSTQARYPKAYAILGIAEVLSLMGKYDASISEYKDALEESKVLGHRLEEAHSLLGIAEAERLKGKTNLNRYNEAMEIYRDIGSKWGMAHTLIGRALSRGNANEDLEQAARICHRAQLSQETKLIQQLLRERESTEIHILNFR